MCRNIKTLFNFEPPATDAEIRASSIQYVRKLSGSTQPSRANQAAFDEAVEAVFLASKQLLASLVTSAPPKNRTVQAARGRTRGAAREAPTAPGR